MKDNIVFLRRKELWITKQSKFALIVEDLLGGQSSHAFSARVS